jgi:hypothetical protein
MTIRGVSGVGILWVFLVLAAPPAAWAECLSPGVSAGAREWFPAEKNYRLCNGTAWVPFSVLPVFYYGGPTHGLRGWWRFDDNAGAVAADVSGNGNAATLMNFPAMPWQPAGGKIAGALAFDGTNDYASVVNEAAFDFTRSDPFSITVWYYRDSDETEDDLIEKVTSGYRGYALWMPAAGGCAGASRCVEMTFVGTNTMAVYTAPDSVAIGQWQHVAMTYDGSADFTGIKIYIDGVNQSLSFVGGALAGSTLNDTPLSIGVDPIGGTCCNFDGRLDDLRIYDYALSATEVADIVTGACTKEAQMDYDRAAGKYYVCNGTVWQEMTCPAGDCGNLGACAGAGAVDYFPAAGAMAWCDGMNWQIMAR